MARKLAQALGEFAANLRFSQLPTAAIRTAKTGVIDCVAVMVAGSVELPVQILRKTLNGLGGVPEATLYLSAERMPAPDAAWINGMAGHVLDYDDFARGHPSVVIVPAILAEGEALDASGADIVTAYVAGYEVWMELVTRERGNYQMKGWHPTPLIGALAAAAACANLRRLDAAAVTAALGLAAAQASGITASYGTMAKSMQVGKAAHTGVISVRMAADGMTALPEVLDHEQGFLRAVSPAGDVDVQSAPRLGERWHITERGLSIKRYPVCYCAHRAIDATINLISRQPLEAEDIDRIEVSLSRIHATILKNHRPTTGLAAKFSAEFAVAASVLAGNVGLQEVNDAFVTRREVQELMRRVTVVTNENYDPEAPGFALWDQVHVFLKDSRVLESEQVRHALGNAKRPLGTDDLRRKFLDCMAAGDQGFDAEQLFRDLETLEHLASCRALAARRRGPAAAAA
ncbi:MAG: hypothetical protein A3G24_15290 [Betaproteobacteria bacterium RIFCSPLOWO2_12_FULL_62_13]|nr:MAG: hypothetical protein A3G24_15290 [Betaproteobacteria bacterium RIFCSPLOWO2_12_FULL_62_13]